MLTCIKSLRKSDSLLTRSLIMQMVSNQIDQRPAHFFVRKNQAVMSADVANFSAKISDSSIFPGALISEMAGPKRFPLVSSCQQEKPTT